MGESESGATGLGESTNEERAENITATSIKVRVVLFEFLIAKFYLDAATSAIKRLENKLNIVLNDMEKGIKHDPAIE